MTQFARILAAVLLVVSAASLVGCGKQYVKGTTVKYTAERQQLADLVERYRRAVEMRDAESLRKMASLNYYENGSTTTKAEDDYDFNGLQKVLADLKNQVKAVKYAITIKDIHVLGETARVDYEYESQYLIAVGEQDRWATHGDKNRLTFRREEGEWRILAGM